MARPLVAIAEFDLVATVVGLEFGQTTGLSRIIYGLAGLSAAYLATSCGPFANGKQAARTR